MVRNGDLSRSLLGLPCGVGVSILLAVLGCDSRGNSSREAVREMPAACLECLDTIGLSPTSLRLTQVDALDVDSHDNVYLVDIGSRSVIVLGADGSYRRTVGRGGGGPGEFATSPSIQVIPGNVLLAYDASLARLTRFAPGADKVLQTMHVSAHRGGLPTGVLATRDGAYLAFFEQPFVAGRPEISDSVRSVLVGVLDSLGDVVRDSILAVPGGEILVVRSRGAVMAGGRPFGREVLFQTRNALLWYVLTDHPAVYRVSLADGRRDSIPLPFQAPPIAAKQLDDAAALLPELLRMPFRKDLPNRWPLIRGFVANPDGTLWVDIAADAERQGQWIRLDQVGRVVERLAVPWNVTLKAVRGDRYYALAKDSDDAPRVLIVRKRPQVANSGTH